MTAIKLGLKSLIVGALLLSGLASSATYNDVDIWNAMAQGESPQLGLSTNLKNTVTIDDSGSIYKNVVTNMNAIGANQVQL